MKKLNIRLILGIVIALLVVTIGIGGINKYLTSHKYEVIEPSTTNESKEELNSVVEVITKGTYESIQSLNNEKEKAYVVIADKNIDDSDINKIIKIGTDLNIKISFLDNNIVNKNENVQRNGDTIVSNGINLERNIKEKQIEAVNLEKFYSFNAEDTKSVVIFVENVKKLEDSKEKFNEKIKDLKSEGYMFKAFA
ncbi:MAG: hypothetical protein ACRC30_01125 [Clostridium sp.]